MVLFMMKEKLKRNGWNSRLKKEQIIQKINEISTMNHDQLSDFAVKVSMSDADQKAKSFLYRAIDLRSEELVSNDDRFVLMGEIDGDVC